jgi:hypothetical protein
MKIVSVKNLNTNEELLKPEKGHSLTIVELGKQSVVFEIPLISQKFYSKILVTGTIHLKGDDVEFQFIGKVANSENYDNTTRVSVDLIQYDKNLWVQHLQVGRDKQDRADRIFHSIKGEG